MLPPRLNPTISTSGRGILPRFHSCIPGLWNHKAGLAIARGRFAKGENGVENGLRTYTYICMRNASSSSSSSSSTRWKSRQGKDWFARAAKVKGLRSRAAFKLLEVCVLFICVCVCGFGGGGRDVKGLWGWVWIWIWMLMRCSITD